MLNFDKLFTCLHFFCTSFVEHNRPGSAIDEPWGSYRRPLRFVLGQGSEPKFWTSIGQGSSESDGVATSRALRSACCRHAMTSVCRIQHLSQGWTLQNSRRHKTWERYKSAWEIMGMLRTAVFWNLFGWTNGSTRVTLETMSHIMTRVGSRKNDIVTHLEETYCVPFCKVILNLDNHAFPGTTEHNTTERLRTKWSPSANMNKLRLSSRMGCE